MLFEHCLYALFYLLLKLNFFYVNGELLNVRQDINKNNEDAYYDGDSQQFNNIQTSDCSIQCPPYWTEPVQQIQSLVYPAAAFVSLKCPYNGKPTPQLTWYKDDQVFVPKSYELSDLYSIDNYYLNISKATMYEKGIYKCMIENSLGNISRSFELRVQGRSFDRAVILSQTTNQTLYEGDNVTFECYFYSDSSPFVQWFIQRSIFQEFKFIKEYNPQTMTEDEVKLMTINNAQINDTGTYLCRVLNEYGFVDLLHHLNVLPGALRPTLPPIRHQIAGMVEELIIAITSVIAILIFSFTLFLIYHCRNQKSLRRSLLATRILATGGSENLKGNPIYRSEFESKTKRPLLEDGCRRFPTEATISTIISSYYDDQCEFSREKLIMGHLLGKGAFGFVYQAIAYNIIPGEQSTTVAVKTVRDDATTDEIENLLKELAVMKMVGKHPNIINLFGCCTKGGQVMLIVEYAKYGNLRDYLRCKRPSGHVLSGSFESEENDDYHVDEIIDTLTTLDLLLFCLQVASGMDYLHSKKCIHRDLAARNVLLAENRVCKICDFGLARDLTQNYYYRKQTDGRVPVKWMSPEALFDRKFSTKSDIWSFAILAWEIMTYGGTPYPSVPAEKLFDYLRDGSRMSKPANCPNEIFKIIENCWEFKENLRPSFQQVCERLQRYLYGTSPIDYSDLDYVDLPLSPSTSDFAQTLFPTSTRTTTRTNDDIGSSIPSTITTAATSSSSLT